MTKSIGGQPWGCYGVPHVVYEQTFVAENNFKINAERVDRVRMVHGMSCWSDERTGKRGHENVTGSKPIRRSTVFTRNR